MYKNKNVVGIILQLIFSLTVKDVLLKIKARNAQNSYFLIILLLIF